jgi:ABC-type branched-subunit amino acid transport system ATPase component
MLSLENICDWSFLRPNGAGETATMRTIFGLVPERRWRIARGEAHDACPVASRKRFFSLALRRLGAPIR